ncbi:hypothetical protein C5167_002523 [Papaver somniferum]|uniref:Uncharacterized protein n=1 Tax=Papaver somniferum TaxID=3469 RepID=A0A4Y7KZG0_PAPSO|nr:hypothetical protein C5167_002523 [Papaver somniferum]
MEGDDLGFKDFQAIPHTNSFVSLKALGKGAPVLRLGVGDANPGVYFTTGILQANQVFPINPMITNDLCHSKPVAPA